MNNSGILNLKNKNYDNSNINPRYIFEINNHKNKYIPRNSNIEIVNNFESFKNFYNLNFRLYKDNPLWVPPFWYEFKDFFKKNNPFWAHSDCLLFLLKKNNIVIGRIAAIIDYKFCEVTHKKVGYFGFFECINDYKSSEILFETAMNWLKFKKIDYMRGPIDGRIDIGCGFLIEGFDSRPCILSSYSPPYYFTFAKKFKMKKIRDLYLYYIDLTKNIPEQLKEKSLECVKLGIKIRRFNRFKSNKELRWWVNLFLETFSDHWGYVPVSPEEVKTRFGVKQIRWYIDSDLFLIAELNGLPVAYLWSTPDYNQIFQKMNGKLGPYQLAKFLITKRKINMGKLSLIGIKKECRIKNIASGLNYLILVEMKKRGYIGAEVGWIDEENDAAHKTIAITGAKVYKKYSVFEIKIKDNK